MLYLLFYHLEIPFLNGGLYEKLYTHTIFLQATSWHDKVLVSFSRELLWDTIFVGLTSDYILSSKLFSLLLFETLQSKVSIMVFETSHRGHTKHNSWCSLLSLLLQLPDLNLDLKVLFVCFFVKNPLWVKKHNQNFKWVFFSIDYMWLWCKRLTIMWL